MLNIYAQYRTRVQAWYTLTYITLNEDVYNTDTKKIVFMLSYMTKATAKEWKEAYVHNVLATPTANFGTFANFITDL